MAGERSSFRELERANRRQAAVLIGGQILVFALFGFGLDLIFHGMFFGGGRLGFLWFTVAAVSSAVIYTLRTYYGGPGMVLGAVAAFPIPDDEPKKKILLDVAREMAVAARLLEPQVYMIDDPAPNALAVGRNPHDSVICVTRGLVNGMDREELQGVIAHEMAHIRSYDAWLATLVTATRLGRIGSFPASLYQTLTRGTGVLLSRESEYLADGAAVEFTRNPTALIRALQQIEKTAAPLKHASPAVAPLFIADPMNSASGKIRDEYPRNALQQAVSTHPALADRIARLQQLVKAAGDSKGEASSDEIAANRSESAHFVTNLVHERSGDGGRGSGIGAARHADGEKDDGREIGRRAVERRVGQRGTVRRSAQGNRRSEQGIDRRAASRRRGGLERSVGGKRALGSGGQGSAGAGSDQEDDG